MLVHLVFANIILTCFFFFFLIIDLYILIPAVIVQLFNPIARLIIPIETPRKEAKPAIKIHALLFIIINDLFQFCL